MGFVYNRAEMKDIELLVKTRIEVLRAANRLGDDAEMSLVEQKSREYYEETLQAETHIAYHTLELLIEEVKKKGVSHISLEATNMGRPLYERYGFVKMNDEMELPKERL